MKRIVSLVFAILLAAGMFCVQARASEVEVLPGEALPEENSPEVPMATGILERGTCGTGLTWTLYTDGYMTIYGTGDVYGSGSSYYIKMPWYDVKDKILQAVVNYGVSSLGEMSFSGCVNMTGITIDDSVTSLGDRCFSYCSSLTDITLPDRVTSLGNGCFSYCSSLTGITIPDGVRSLGDFCFSDCRSLKNLTIPDSVTSLGYACFENCTGLRSIAIPDGVTNLEDKCFQGCASLSSITIPDSVTSLGDGCFYGCTSLRSLTIPEKVSQIGTGCFDGTSSMIEITFRGNAAFPESAFDGVKGTVYYPEDDISWADKLVSYKAYNPDIEWIPYHIHRYTSHSVISPTCVEQGYTIHSCRCGESYRDTYTDATGQHTEAVLPYQAPTCTETGKEAGAECAVCKAVLYGREIIPAMGHAAVVAMPKKDPTCSTVGYTEKLVCKTCSTVLQEPTRIPILPHEIVCTRCNVKKDAAPLAVQTPQTPEQNQTAEQTEQTPLEISGEEIRQMLLADMELQDGSNGEIQDESVMPLLPLEEQEENAPITPMRVQKLETESNDSMALAERIEHNEIIVGNLSGQDMDWFTFALSSTSEVRFIATANCDSFIMGVYNSAGQCIASDITGTRSEQFYNYTITRTLGAGRYFIAAFDCYESVNQYAVSILIESVGLPHVHVAASTKTVAPTCTQAGYIATLCSCGYTMSKTPHGAPTGHEEVVWKGQAATCTENGLTDGKKCRTCDAVLRDQSSIPALGHHFVCRLCGEENTDAVLPEGIERIAGQDRHDTAFRIADKLKEVLGVEKFQTILIASGSDSADALAGSYLAARKGAPILLSRGNSHQRNLDYINANLAPDGIVYILGGPAAVPEEMEDLLIQSGISCRRLSGSNRFETNLAILNEAGMDGDEILVSTAYNFADSLSASASGKPILLVNTRGNALSPAQETWLTELQGKTITIIGGESAVSAELENALSAFGSVRRIYGAGREATSVEVAENYFSSPSAALLAYSRNFPDGLCGGPLAYAMQSPLLLVNAGQEAYAGAYVRANAITRGYILGGNKVISNQTAETVFRNS